MKDFGARNYFILITNFVLKCKEQADGNQVLFYLLGSIKSITEISENPAAMGKSRDTRDHTRTMAAV